MTKIFESPPDVLTILIIIAIPTIIKIIYYLSLHHKVVNTEINTDNIDTELCKMNEKLIEQSDRIIKNQERIIELLENKNSAVDNDHGKSQ